MASKVAIDKLPPTADALKHCLRAIHQVIIWSNALTPIIAFPDPRCYGWKMENGSFSPFLMSKLPVPTLTAEISFCSCKTGKSTIKNTYIIVPNFIFRMYEYEMPV